MDLGKLFGRSMAFPPRVNAEGRVVWSEGEQNVRESIRVILMTEPGERLMLPEFGAGLGEFLHEPNTLTTRRAIASRITKALEAWEPRISVQSVDVEAVSNLGRSEPGAIRSSSTGVTVAPVSTDAEPSDVGERAAMATITYRLVATSALERVSLRVSLAGV